MELTDFIYNLPKELIAQDPCEKRDESRLLLIDRKTGELSHHVFKDIIDFLNPGDTLVINDTKVIPARLIGNLLNSDGSEGRICEVFLVKRISDKTWECLVKPGKKLRIGSKVSFGSGKLLCEIKDIVENGNRIVEFDYNGIFEEILDALGEMPLPPYITKKLIDKDRYQTVYAKNNGSVAAPTAGLHFTDELLTEIEKKGVNIAKITLHVSLGTFRPVKVDNIEDHKMHFERYYISDKASNTINKSKLSNNKIICVGTTSVRTLETAAYYDEKEKCYLLKPCEGETNIFIHPGYKFKLVDSLITNFHLPGSTLIMLVSAFATRDIVMNAYNVAMKEKYRFYSFGDACYFH